MATSEQRVATHLITMLLRKGLVGQSPRGIPHGSLKKRGCYRKDEAKERYKQ